MNMEERIQDPKLRKKYENLKQILQKMGKAAIAFSSGVDSTLLLKIAHEELGDEVLAVTAISGTFPKRESREADDFCKEQGITQVTIESKELERPEFCANPPDRCYICKKSLFQQIIDAAKEKGIEYVCEGSNMDDLGDYRPGLKAVSELGVRSPLREAGLYKKEIRELSRLFELSTSEKPSFACLASRFVYGEVITKERLKMVEEAEQFLLDHQFPQFRVRMHGTIARIEVLPQDIPRFLEESFRKELVERFLEIGFSYVSLDLKGFRSGSMNETLGRSK